MQNNKIYIEVFTFTDVAQNKLNQLSFTEMIFQNESRGVKTFDILLSHEDFSEVHLCFTEILDEEVFRRYELARKIQENLILKPRIVVQYEKEISNFQTDLGELKTISPVRLATQLVEQVIHQQYGFIIAHEYVKPVPAKENKLNSNAHLKLICLHQKLMPTNLLAEDLIEIPYLLIDEKADSALYFQLRKESGCVALVLDHPQLKKHLDVHQLPRLRVGGEDYIHIRENPLDLDILIVDF